MESKVEAVEQILESVLREEKPANFQEEDEELQLDDDDSQKIKESVLEHNGYVVQETIGTGAFSCVKKAFCRSSKQTVAVKIISKTKATKDVLNKFLPREIELVRGLKHSNLIRFYECIETTMRFYIIMQYAEKGSLLQLIRKEKYLEEERARIYFSQLIGAVEYIHSIGIVHRDIKCENIVFDSKFRLKLIDFGFARGNMQPVSAGGKIKPVLSKTFCGSHAYASPEILKSIPYQPQLSDIWAVGVVLYTMVFGRLPFSNNTNITALLKQVSAGPRFPRDRCVSDDCKNLILKILRPVGSRISIEEMRLLPWLSEEDSGYDDSSFERRDDKRIKLDGTVAIVKAGPDKNGQPIHNCNNACADSNSDVDSNNNIDNINNNYSNGSKPSTTTSSVPKRKVAVPNPNPIPTPVQF